MCVCVCEYSFHVIFMLNIKYDDIIQIYNLLATWERFLCGKRHKKDVIQFQAELSKNVVNIYTDLINKTYE